MTKSPTYDLKPDKPKKYNPTGQEKTVSDLVSRRKADMQMFRTTVDKDWSDYQKQIEAIWQPYPDGRSSFSIPVTRALIELGISEEIRVPYTRQIRAEKEEYQDRATAYEEVRNLVGRIGHFDWNLLRNAYTCWGIGTSIIYTHFERTVKEQWEASFTALDDIDYKKKYVIQNGILVEDFNINNFYPDNQVTDYADANDTIAEQIVPWETFKTLENQSIYMNIDKVQPA